MWRRSHGVSMLPPSQPAPQGRERVQVEPRDEGEQAQGAAEHEEEGALEVLDAAAAAGVDAFTAALQPEAFVQPSAELAELARQAAKALYDYGAAQHQEVQVAAAQGAMQRRGAAASAAPLPELYVEGFDPEQIWLQLDMAAAPALKRARRLLKKVGPEAQLLTPETEETVDGELPGLAGVVQPARK